jgi:hypothetical protein
MSHVFDMALFISSLPLPGPFSHRYLHHHFVFVTIIFRVVRQTWSIWQRPYFAISAQTRPSSM